RVEWAPDALEELIERCAAPSAGDRRPARQPHRDREPSGTGGDDRRQAIHNGAFIDLETFTVRCGKKECRLPNGREYAVLRRLCRRPGAYVNVDSLIEEVWRDYGEVEKNTVQKTIGTLRTKLRNCGIVEIRIDGGKTDHYAVLPAT
ncbi:MAG TPA: winged helix-turn-helix domain-containing protein, partial [Pirellulales bacterium]|nr:winged helix-turn-helix domain-containing protein [Pirellulales bacterium]